MDRMELTEALGVQRTWGFSAGIRRDVVRAAGEVA